MEIRTAEIPAELPIVRELFQEYADGLGIDLCFQGFAEELATLPGKYASPAGGIWLGVENSNAAGCIALRPLDAERCEIKRLYVRPAFRGTGLGKKLAEKAISAATAAGYRRVYLDTLNTMSSAIRLYRSLGFTDAEAYCHNPVQGALFFSLELAGRGDAL